MQNSIVIYITLQICAQGYKYIMLTRWKTSFWHWTLKIYVCEKNKRRNSNTQYGL